MLESSGLSSVGIKYDILIDIDFQLYRNCLNILHNKEKDVCDQCGEKFVKYEDLIRYASHTHRHPIVKCMNVAKNSFMKKIDYIMSEKNIKRRLRTENSNLNQREK